MKGTTKVLKASSHRAGQPIQYTMIPARGPKNIRVNSKHIGRLLASSGRWSHRASPQPSPSPDDRRAPATRSRARKCRPPTRVEGRHPRPRRDEVVYWSGGDDLRLHRLELVLIDHALRLEVGQSRELARTTAATATSRADCGLHLLLEVLLLSLRVLHRMLGH